MKSALVCLSDCVGSSTVPVCLSVCFCFFVPADQRVSLYNVFVFGLFIAQTQTHTFSLSPIFFAVSAVTQSASQLFVWLHRS